MSNINRGVLILESSGRLLSIESGLFANSVHDPLLLKKRGKKIICRISVVGVLLSNHGILYVNATLGQ